MYNIKALEDDWKKYNRKKKRPWYILMLLLVVILSVAAWLGLNDGEFYRQLSSQKQKQKQNIVPADKTKIYIDGALDDMEYKNSQKTVDAPIEIPNVPDDDVGVSSETSHQTRKKLHIEVIEAGKGSGTFKEIAKRFRLGHDTDDSLFLAKSYYKRKEYKKAAYWALQTNKVNDNIDESWLIFAKAKAKQGHRNEAIRILTNYIQKSRSVEAKVLLEKIKAGKRI